ncbi:MAG: ion transporter [Candidatus Gracilibacteria bacterium]|nr:ion transporter [Candidatus Gracilibacteria bacterium]
MFKKYFSGANYDNIKYENILDDPKSKLGVFLDSFILFLVISFPFILILESLGNNSFIYFDYFFAIDAFISIVFAIEYFYRLVRARKKLDFIVHPMRIIDLLSFLPFFLGFISTGSILKTLRILRVLRILRLMKKIPLTSGFIKALNDYKDEYIAVFTLYFVILFLGSFFVYYSEKSVLGTDFTSIPQALRWGIVTTATVGYGDIYPITTLGKLFGSILVFLGPLLGGLISAVTIMVFMETYNNQESQKNNRKVRICTRCTSRSPRIANYCIKCGKDLNKNSEKSKSELNK